MQDMVRSLRTVLRVQEEYRSINWERISKEGQKKRQMQGEECVNMDLKREARCDSP